MGIKQCWCSINFREKKPFPAMANIKNNHKRRFFHSESILPSANQTVAGNDIKVLLVPFKTLVSYPFSLPFGRKGKMCEALALKFRPMLGESEAFLSLVPQVIEQTSSRTCGIAWFVSKKEVDAWEERFGANFIFWPAPLAFIPENDSPSLVLYSDDSGTCGILFENKTPLIYRWIPHEEDDAESLGGWMDVYAESIGKKIASCDIYKASELTDETLQHFGVKALTAVPGLDSLSLSNEGADRAKEIESFLNKGYKAVKLTSLLGLFFLMLSVLFFAGALKTRESFETAPAGIYSILFGEESRNPLRSVNKQLKLLRGDGAQMTFEQVLSNFSAAWKNANASSGIKIDAIRYGSERTEIQGLADSTTVIEAFRDALGRSGFSAKLGDVQQVPGSGLRFSISLAGVR